MKRAFWYALFLGGALVVMVPPEISAQQAVGNGPQPTASATGCGLVSWSGLTLHADTTACSVSGTPSPTNTPFETVVTNTSGVTNAWSLSQTGAFAGGCPGTFAAYVGVTSIPTPSPVPSGLICGSKTIASDGNASVFFPDTSTDYLTFPAVMPSTLPTASATWSLEMAIQTGGNNSGTSTRSSFIAIPGTGIIYCTNENGSGNLGVFTGGAAHTIVTAVGSCIANRPSLIDWVFNAGTCFIYVNGLAIATPTTNSGACSTANQSAVGFIGRDTGTTQNFMGLIADLSIYSTALSASTIQQHYFAFRCGGLTIGTCAP